MADGDASLTMTFDAKIDALIDKCSKIEAKLGSVAQASYGSAAKIRDAIGRIGQVDMESTVRRINLTNQLFVAQEAGNRKEAAAITDQIYLLDQVAKQRKLGLSLTEAQAVAEKQVAAVAAARALAAGRRPTHLAEAGNVAVGGIKGAVLEEGAASLGVVGGALEAIGPAGFAAAAAIGAVAVSVEHAKVVAEWAEDLQDTAETLGLTTRALQEFDFVAGADNIPVEKMRASLGGLNEVVGKVIDNLGKVKQAKGAFGAIFGVDADKAPEKLRELGDLQHILPQIIDYAAQLNASQRAGLASVLKIDPDVLRSLVAGRAGISDLIEEAHKMGVIFDEDVIKKAAEASTQLNVATRIIDGEMKSAFIDIAPSVAGFATNLARAAAAIADMVRGVKDAIGWTSQLIDKLNQIPGLHANSGEIGEKIKWAVRIAVPAVGGVEGLANLAQGAGQSDRGSASLQNGISAVRDLLKAPEKPLHALAPDAPKTGHSDAASVTKDVQDKLAAATKDALTALAALTGDIFAHAELEKDAAEVERGKQQADLTEIAAKVASSKSLSAASKKTLDAELALARTKVDEAAQAKKDKIDRDASVKFEQSSVADAEAVDTFYQQLAPILEARAKTLREAQAIEVANLLHTQKLARDRTAAENFAAENRSDNAQPKSQSAAIVAAQNDLQREQRTELADKQAEALSAEQLQLTLVSLDTQKQSLDHELSLADSQDQRRKIGLQRLALDEEQQRLQQQQIIDSKASSAQEKDLARSRLKQLQDLHAGKVEDIGRQTEGPIAAFARQGRQALGSDNLQSEFVGALGDMNSGLATAIVNAKSFGDVGAQVFKQLGVDLIKNLLEQGEASLLSAGAGAAGAAGGGGGGILGLLSAGAHLLGFAGGGKISGRGGPTSDSNVVAVSDEEYIVNARATRANLPLLDAINSGKLPHFAGGGLVGTHPPVLMGGGGRGVVNLNVTSHNDLRGAVGEGELNQRLAVSQRQTVAVTLDTVRRALPSWQIQNTYERG